MMRLAEILYEDYIGYGTPQEIEVTSDDLEEEHKAMGLFWYQYHTNDERISNEGEYNAAKLNDLRHIYYELYGDLMDEGILVFLSEYCEQRDGDTIYMSGTGDFGAVGEFYFDEPNDVVGEDGVLTITGPVMVYSGEDYVPDCLYEVVFTEHENMPGQYVFESVKVS